LQFNSDSTPDDCCKPLDGQLIDEDGKDEADSKQAVEEMLIEANADTITPIDTQPKMTPKSSNAKCAHNQYHHLQNRLLFTVFDQQSKTSSSSVTRASSATTSNDSVVSPTSDVSPSIVAPTFMGCAQEDLPPLTTDLPATSDTNPYVHP
jgi:hypothetical protein